LVRLAAGGEADRVRRWHGLDRVRASTPNDGLFSSWKPATDTATGRIRLTPVAGNFPVVSETFRVV